MKTIAEVVESAASFDLPDPFPAFQAPEQFVPAHGLNWDPSIQWPAQRAEYERRMVEERLTAVVGWATANGNDTPPYRARLRRLCIVTVGKGHRDQIGRAHVGTPVTTAQIVSHFLHDNIKIL